jgi:6-phosphogluconolactonase (cycloisomerase 2 family)
MKFGFKAIWSGAVSAGLILGIAACGRSNTIDYVFVANNSGSPGQINVYLVDNESGVLTQTSTSPYSVGNNPVSLATSPDQKFLYVLNRGDNTIVSYSIGSDATLTKANTYTTPGSSPTSMKINSAGTYLYVTDAYQSGFSATNPGPGAVVAYPISSDGSLGTGVSYPVCNNPVDLQVITGGGNVYVIDDPASQPERLSVPFNPNAVAYTASGACAADSGQVNGFSVSSSGALSAVPGSPFAAGSTPSAITGDPTDRFIYVADLLNNQVISFGIENNGALSAINNGLITVGSYPDALTVDPRGLYLYVANFNSGTVTGYSIAQSTGVPNSSAGGGSYTVKAGPTFVLIEPNAGKYLYAADFADTSGFISGAELNANTGALTEVENGTFPTGNKPTAIAAVTHGNHPTEVLPQY